MKEANVSHPVQGGLEAQIVGIDSITDNGEGRISFGRSVFSFEQRLGETRKSKHHLTG